MRTPRVILLILMSIVVMSAVSILHSANSQQKKAEQSYTRPKPTRPAKPYIPGSNRFQEDKVFLENAEVLFRPENEPEEVQVVSGNVKFRHGSMWMYCDSAFYYPERNALNAFGHVEMRQGDTLFVYADRLYYDGFEKHAKLVCGLSRSKVQLKDPKVTLTTDSLDYDLNAERGWYEAGGHLEDDLNSLTSVYGEYSPATKQAIFSEDVLLVNRKDGYRLITERLDYNTGTHIADINSSTRIEGANDTIITSSGWYDTSRDNANLTSRSTIVHSDSTGNVTTLEGDSIIYDKPAHVTRAYMFGDERKMPRPMVLTDTARKVTLIGGFGEYNDSSRVAFSSNYPLLIEYSRPDSLFLRADTILSRILTETVALDSLTTVSKDFHTARAISNARFFTKDIQGIADTIFFREKDSMLFLLRKPVIWSGQRQVYGNRIDVHFNDSSPDWAHLPQGAMVAEYIDEDFYDQLAGTDMMAYFSGNNLNHLDVSGNVQVIMLPQENDSSYNKLVNAESSFMSLDMDGRKMEKLKMWPEVSGSVSPLFSVKKAQQYLPGFRWLEALRPKRKWYGDGHVEWEDELGEISDELRSYFNETDVVRPVPVSPYDAMKQTGLKSIQTNTGL